MKRTIYYFLDLENLWGNYKYLFLRIICNLCYGIEIDLLSLVGCGKLCNFAADIN